MPRWVRRVYITITDFVLPRPLRAAFSSAMGRNAKQLHTESVKSGKCGKSDQSSESVKSNKFGQHKCPSHPTRICNCRSGTCDDNNSTNLHVDRCICSLCRGYNEYINATSKRAKGQNTGSWIWDSAEPRSIKQPDTNATRTNVEYITGIPTGTTL